MKYKDLNSILGSSIEEAKRPKLPYWDRVFIKDLINEDSPNSVAYDALEHPTSREGLATAGDIALGHLVESLFKTVGGKIIGTTKKVGNKTGYKSAEDVKDLIDAKSALLADPSDANAKKMIKLIKKELADPDIMPEDFKYYINKNNLSKKEINSLINEALDDIADTPDKLVKMIKASVPDDTFGHMLDTPDIFRKLLETDGRWSAEEIDELVKASKYHDYGKAALPKEAYDNVIKGKQSIMDIHDSLGADLLEKAGADKKAVDIARNHHNVTPDADVIDQYFSMADILNARLTDRPYLVNKSLAKRYEELDDLIKTGDFSKNRAGKVVFSDETMDVLKKAFPDMPIPETNTYKNLDKVYNSYKHQAAEDFAKNISDKTLRNLVDNGKIDKEEYKLIKDIQEKAANDTVISSTLRTSFGKVLDKIFGSIPVKTTMWVLNPVSEYYQNITSNDKRKQKAYFNTLYDLRDDPEIYSDLVLHGNEDLGPYIIKYKDKISKKYNWAAPKESEVKQVLKARMNEQDENR